MTTQFNVPSTIIVGGGARNELAAQVQRLRAARVLVVTDKDLEQRGVIAPLAKQLEEAGVAVSVFSDVQPDPTVKNVQDGLAAARELGAAAIVAVGGGSPIDAAKAIAIMAANEPPISTYAGYHKVPNAGIPLIAIPTTAGTGSEVSKVAVITDTERNVKMMMLDRHLLPTVAIVDYELTLSMPKGLTAHVGVDTLTHGIEAYVSRKANAMTDPIALSCIRLTAENLRTAWNEPDDRAAREAMALAACQGGMAFANSSVCLVHGMSRPLGAVFHLPHGLSNSVLLPAVTRFSLPAATARYAEVARTMGLAHRSDLDEDAAGALVTGLERLNVDLQVPRLRDCVKADQAEFEKALPKMAEDALASGSPQNNPIVPTTEEIVALYRESW
jgi:alcohol dehydrogenase class IV